MTIPSHEKAIVELREKTAEIQAELRGMRAGAAEALDRVRAVVEEGLGANAASLADIYGSVTEASAGPWASDRWEDWRPGSSDGRGWIRMGRMLDSRSGDDLGVPWLLPLVGSGRAIVIRSRGADQAALAEGLLQSLVVRTAALCVQQSRYTLLDPAHNGLSFPMARHLDRVMPHSGDTRRDLDEVIREIQRIISTYLDAGTTSFEGIPDEMRLNEQFHFVFAADFANRYDLRAAEALQTVARSGPRAGVYLFVHHNLDHQPEADLSKYAIEDPLMVDCGTLETEVSGGLKVRIVLDTAPSAELQELLFTRIRNAPPVDRPVQWDDVSALPHDQWWTASSDSIVTAPLGRHGANNDLSVWFGEHEREQRNVAHGVLGAMTGSGKSTMFHSLILSLAIRYSPQELRFYLIDGKFGVEFQPYRRLPHAEVVSLRTSPELARSVLSQLVHEMERRNTIFTKHNVADFTGYRQFGSSSGNLPRLLLFVDEYQQLFEDDVAGEGSALLLKLSQQGRSVGIHMLLASQTFDSKGMLHRSEIFGNIHMRLAMKMSQDEISGLTEFGPKGRRLISATTDRPGRITVNDNAGDDESNVAGKVALLSDGLRDEILGLLEERAMGSASDEMPTRIVFNGTAQPNLIENPRIESLLSVKDWPGSEELEHLARTSAAEGGLGISDWLAGERPLALYVGQEFNVRGHASIVLRRRPSQNVMLIGDRNMERVAMTVALMISAGLCEGPEHLRLQVIDRSVLRTDWAGALEQTVQSLASLRYDIVFTREEAEASKLIRGADEEIERRRSLSEDKRIDQPTLLLVLNEPDRITDLRQIPDDYGAVDSDLGRVLRAVVTQGPSVGVHVVASCGSLGVARSVWSERLIQSDFAYRVALQMSEDDSFVYTRSSAASRLQTEERPIVALVFDSTRQSTTRFKPYSLEASHAPGDETSEGLMSDVAQLVSRLEGSRG